MVRLIFLAMAAALIAGASGIDGKWSGSMQAAGGDAPDGLTLIVEKTEGRLSGSLTWERDGVATPFYTPLRNSEFSFQVRDPIEGLLTFRLTVSDSGINGEATGGKSTKKVSFPLDKRTDWFTAPSEPLSAPVLIRKTDPEYTQEARDAKVQGTVVLEVNIDAGGRVNMMRVAKSLGMGLDVRAFECVRQWQFKPALTASGLPKSSQAVIEVNFKL